MSDSDAKDVRNQPGPVENPDADEAQFQADPRNIEPRPRIAIGEALRNHWFEIWYQPKIDLKRKCLAGAEALARIHHPQLGVLSPGSFLADVDEDSIAELTQHALLAALCDWMMFEEAGFNLHLAVNVPANLLLKLPIEPLVSAYRPQSDRWPGLIVEVTEDQIVRDVALAREIATALRASGVTIAIDDFGAGYSSFSSLRDLPFAELKIDRSFVEGCATDATNAAICQTAIDLAHRFGSSAVAEGVESQTDLQALMVMGCDFGQGALIAPPMAKEHFLAVLRQRMNKPRPATPKDAMPAAATPKAATPAPAASKDGMQAPATPQDAMQVPPTPIDYVA
jgi:EAL domain-containing protein (putative c-di-GMP-specific phosphodiesterase class I)